MNACWTAGLPMAKNSRRFHGGCIQVLLKEGVEARLSCEENKMEMHSRSPHKL